jgi:hypothetical protein
MLALGNVMQDNYGGVYVPRQQVAPPPNYYGDRGYQPPPPPPSEPVEPDGAPVAPENRRNYSQMTTDERNRLIIDIGEELVMAYSKCDDDDSQNRCIAIKFAEGMRGNAGRLLCAHPDWLNRIPMMSDDIRSLIIIALRCEENS